MEVPQWPKCTCGHESDDHNYDPSGCAGSGCLFAEGGHDKNGWPVGKKCECSDYEPIGERENVND